VNRILNTLIATAVLAASAGSALADQYGASLKTPGFEDVVIVDPVTALILNGAEDGLAAQSFLQLYTDAQRDPKSRVVSYSERVFQAQMPPMPGSAGNFQIVSPKATQLQSMVVARRQDVLKAKRFMVLRPFEIFADTRKRDGNNNFVPARDSLGNYLLRLKHSEEGFLKPDKGTSQMMFCQRVDTGMDMEFRSNLAGNIRSNCMLASNLSGSNIPWGILLTDATKLPGATALFKEALGGPDASKTATVAAGIIVKPINDVTTGNGKQGRDYEAHQLVLFDTATWQVVAGPFDLKKHNPQLVYAGIDCKSPTDAECAALNPTLPGVTFTFQRF
jgi:hypothetical protein